MSKSTTPPPDPLDQLAQLLSHMPPGPERNWLAWVLSAGDTSPRPPRKKPRPRRRRQAPSS